MENVQCAFLSDLSLFIPLDLYITPPFISHSKSSTQLHGVIIAKDIQDNIGKKRVKVAFSFGIVTFIICLRSLDCRKMKECYRMTMG